MNHFYNVNFLDSVFVSISLIAEPFTFCLAPKYAPPASVNWTERLDLD